MGAQMEAAASQRSDTWQWVRKFLRIPQARIGLVLIVTIVLSALLAPVLAPYDPAEQDLLNRVKAPNAEHLLGTDQLGRDVLSRVLFGARISLGNGFLAVALSVALGLPIGLIAGYAGGRLERFLMSAMDVLLGFRTYLLAILVVAILGPDLINVTIAIGVSMFPGTARLVRGEVLAVKEREFVDAARAIGATDWRIMVRHIWPNIMAPLVVLVTFNVASAVTVESALSFLQLGPPPPTPAWGLMISEGRRYILSAAWLPAIPGAAIMLTVLAFNLLGDALQDVLDPRNKIR